MNMSKIVQFSIVALQSLYRKKLRSFLSILGIVCGVLAVMTMIATGEGAKQKVLEDLENLGLNNIYIEQSPLTATQKQATLAQKSYGLTWYDVGRIEALDSFVENVAGVLHTKGKSTDITDEIVPNLLYASASFLSSSGIRVKRGRFIVHEDMVNNNLICVLGGNIAQQLGPKGLVGKRLRIDHQLYQIIGILEHIEITSTSGKEIARDNPDDMILLPFTRTMKQGGLTSQGSRLDQIVVKLKQGTDVTDAAKVIDRTLQINHNAVSDYSMLVPLELLRQKLKTQKIFNLVLTLVAGISLFVGGIGIMNIMLANVSERTREIGLRRAVGATHSDITFQFLIESVVLTMLGGGFGLLLGTVAIFAIEEFAGWPVRITLLSVVLPFLLAIVCGLVFGLHPATKASKLQPIEALRSL